MKREQVVKFLKSSSCSFFCSRFLIVEYFGGILQCDNHYTNHLSALVKGMCIVLNSRHWLPLLPLIVDIICRFLHGLLCANSRSSRLRWTKGVHQVVNSCPVRIRRTSGLKPAVLHSGQINVVASDVTIRCGQIQREGLQSFFLVEPIRVSQFPARLVLWRAQQVLPLYSGE